MSEVNKRDLTGQTVNIVERSGRVFSTTVLRYVNHPPSTRSEAGQQVITLSVERIELANGLQLQRSWALEDELTEPWLPLEDTGHLYNVEPVSWRSSEDDAEQARRN